MPYMKLIKGFVNTLLVIAIIAVVGAGVGIVYLTVNEYSPDSVETVEVFGSPTTEVAAGDKIMVMTYNIGFGGKYDSQEYYADGGAVMNAGSSSLVSDHLDEMIKLCVDRKAHVNFFQEVDVDSKRSFSIDEASLLSSKIPGRASSFANDYICAWVPIPPTGFVGRIESGSLTLTRFGADSAERRTITDSSAWPASTWSRKPCLLVDRVKLGDSTKELVLINLNFEKYDDGSVRKAQYTELCEFMQLEYANGNYVIAGGSFNAVLPSVDKSKNESEAAGNFTPVDLSTENLTGGWKYCTDDSTPTMRLMDQSFNENSSVYVVDGFITSPNTIVENTQTIDAQFHYSDHNPVVTQVTLVK